MPIVNIVEAKKAIIWDGTNSAEIIDALNTYAAARGAWSLVSETESNLILRGPGPYSGYSDCEIDLGGAFFFWQGDISGWLNSGPFNAFFRVDN